MMEFDIRKKIKEITSVRFAGEDRTNNGDGGTISFIDPHIEIFEVFDGTTEVDELDSIIIHTSKWKDFTKAVNYVNQKIEEREGIK